MLRSTTLPFLCKNCWKNKESRDTLFLNIYSTLNLYERNVTSSLSEKVPMPNQFDPYRDALVVEKHTVWPDEYEDWSENDRSRIEALLHASPEEALDLDYVRQHSGFARIITVTPDDLERVAAT